MPDFCFLGHRQRAHECPACGEAVTGQTATLEHWRWYRGRTSSKRIKVAIDAHLHTLQFCVFCERPCEEGGAAEPFIVGLDGRAAHAHCLAEWRDVNPAPKEASA